MNKLDSDRQMWLRFLVLFDPPAPPKKTVLVVEKQTKSELDGSHKNWRSNWRYWSVWDSHLPPASSAGGLLISLLSFSLDFTVIPYIQLNFLGGIKWVSWGRQPMA